MDGKLCYLDLSWSYGINLLQYHFLLQQLTEFVDKFRSNSVDIDDETKGFQSTIEIEDVLKEANITLNEATLQTDLLNLFYFYLD